MSSSSIDTNHQIAIDLINKINTYKEKEMNMINILFVKDLTMLAHINALTKHDDPADEIFTKFSRRVHLLEPSACYYLFTWFKSLCDDGTTLRLLNMIPEKTWSRALKAGMSGK